MDNILTEENLHAELKKLREHGKKIVTTNGCFDILHAGHVKYLNESKKYGDILIVLLNSDISVRNLKGEGRPVNNQHDRAYVLLNLKAVDYVMLFDENSPSKLLEEIKPDIHTKGADYNEKNLPEADIILSRGGKLKFIEMVEGKSTTAILNKVNKNNLSL